MRFDTAQQARTPLGRMNGEKLDAPGAGGSLRTSRQQPDGGNPSGKLAGEVLDLLGQLGALLQEHGMAAGGGGNAAGLGDKLGTHDPLLKQLAGKAEDDPPPAYDYGAPPAYSRFDPFPRTGQAQVHKEMLQGTGHHPLQPGVDLRPDNEKTLSVAEMKNINGPDGKKYKLIAGLGNQEGMRDKLKQVVGDFDKDPAALARGEAYLQKIKNMPNPDGTPRSAEDRKSGAMGGIGPDGLIGHNTDMGRLKDSFKGGAHVPDGKAPPIDPQKACEWLNTEETKALYVAQVRVNAEKMLGIGNHRLGPQDKLLPPNEQQLSVAQLKDIDAPEGMGGGKKYKLMANLGNEDGVRDKLKQVVGDFDKDPDAFARGEAYLQKIKQMPRPDGSHLKADVVYNGKMSGVGQDGRIGPDSDMAILKDSLKGGAGVPDDKAPQTLDPAQAYGWLEAEQVNATEKTKVAEQARVKTEKVQGIGNHPLGADDDLVPDHLKGKSVAEIRKDYPVLANLGNQEGVRDKLKQVVGDIDNDPKAFMRGVAYLNKIKNMPNPDGSARPDDVIKNGKMEGATKDGDIRSGTELAILKDSFKGGPGVPDEKAPNPIDKNAAYGWLNQQKTLAHTNDPHVKNGGNFVSPAAVVGQQILNGIADVVDFAGGLVNKTIGKIPGLGKVAGLVTDVVTGGVAGGLRVAGVAAVGGDVKAAGIDMGKDMVQNTVENVVGIVDVTGIGAREVGKFARNELDKAIPTTNDGDKSSASGFENRKPEETKPEETKPEENKPEQNDGNGNGNNGNGSGGGRPRRA